MIMKPVHILSMPYFRLEMRKNMSCNKYFMVHEHLLSQVKFVKFKRRV